MFQTQFKTIFCFFCGKHAKLLRNRYFSIIHHLKTAAVTEICGLKKTIHNLIVQNVMATAVFYYHFFGRKHVAVSTDIV